jgi:hypothetical protein
MVLGTEAVQEACRAANILEALSVLSVLALLVQKYKY